jgi:hypothetical protein
MSRMRPELETVDEPCMGYESAYFRVMQAVARKRTLIHGHLHNKAGHSCAIGCAFDDGVTVLPNKVIDEIAEYNDSFPKLSEKERWEKVMAWLKFRTDAMRRKRK